MTFFAERWIFRGAGSGGAVLPYYE
jgi:hypothetical protein